MSTIWILALFHSYHWCILKAVRSWSALDWAAFWDVLAHFKLSGCILVINYFCWDSNNQAWVWLVKFNQAKKPDSWIIRREMMFLHSRKLLRIVFLPLYNQIFIWKLHDFFFPILSEKFMCDKKLVQKRSVFSTALYNNPYIYICIYI